LRFLLITVYWNATPCSLVSNYQRFGGICSLHAHGRRHMPECHRISLFIGLSEYQDSVLKTGPGWLSRHSDSLRVGPFGDRILVVASFSAPVQTGPVAHPAACKMGTESIPGGKATETWR
jgi:hypothetical protein